ncbi:MAG: sodium:solute symporter family protein [Bryobacteraceae bacterium]|jgi:SSS family solute:Na+ symporter/sodium/proline symporter
MIYMVVLAVVVSALLVTTVVKTLGVHGSTDFLVAGRKLPWPVLVFTLLSSWIGAGSLFAGGENAYRNGFAALWQPAGGWAGLLVIGFIAGRARRFAQFTVPDLLELRFNVGARVLGTISIVVAYTVIASYQFIGGGDVLHLIFPELSRESGMYIIAAFVIVFTAAAGMASIAYLDLIIGSLVTLIVIVSVPLLLQHAGGWAQVRATLPATHFQVFGNVTPLTALGFLIPTMLLLVGNQSMYQKFFSARSEKDARFAVYGWIIGTLLLETLLITLAVIGSSMFKTDHPREIIPMSARLGLPPLVGAILLGGVFAKVISTANNYLFSPATNLIHDVYSRFIDRNAPERRTLLASRVIVILLGGFALLQATTFTSVLAASLYAYTIYGAAVTPVVLAVFFWRRTTTAGAIVSIILGAAITIVWNAAHLNDIVWPSIGTTVDAVYPALAASVLSLVIVSLLTPPPAKEKWEPFFTAGTAP